MRLDLTQASYESIYGTKAVEPSQANSSNKALREKVVPCLSDGEPPTASSNSETGTLTFTGTF